MKHAWLIVLCACGGSQTGATGPSNSGGGGASGPSRDQLVTETFQAIASGNTDRLVALGREAVASRKESLDCMSFDAGEIERAQRTEIDKTLANTRGVKIELVSISSSAELGGKHHNATFVPKGGKLAGCTAKTDLLIHDAEVKLRVTKGSSTRETTTELGLVQAGGRWTIYELPTDLESESSKAMAKMDEFSRQMCECRDKACADKVNEDLTKWGTEMAKNAKPSSERPDPELAKRAADSMTRYTECMTKLMMSGYPPPADEP